ncbi:PD-(D/E)XK nuclease-like domain-containing protein [Candidatus Arsenophonus triatominarum]|uniref:PD-(D/E)XK nuclease-like domain-containing protein n=1 Tax=Candidatus Arsenophonus triatominarum TaxID=57911 RepID=UPI0007C58163|nr:PD-(D/E)XK nuclease-like domain-containing protein [Candidatus Arsenophonus triatominarum]
MAEFEAQAVVNNQIVLKKDDFEQIELMRDSVLVSELLENGEPELSIFYHTEKGTLLKIRPDWLGLYSGAPFILDVKTTDDFHDFGKSVDKFGYHLQAAFYQIIVQKVLILILIFCSVQLAKDRSVGAIPCSWVCWMKKIAKRV